MGDDQIDQYGFGLDEVYWDRECKRWLKCIERNGMWLQAYATEEDRDRHLIKYGYFREHYLVEPKLVPGDKRTGSYVYKLPCDDKHITPDCDTPVTP